jgi:hypothetical protein
MANAPRAHDVLESVSSVSSVVLGPLPLSAGFHAHERPPAPHPNLTCRVRSRIHPKGPLCLDGTAISLS